MNKINSMTYKLLGKFSIRIIDLEGINKSATTRKHIVEKVRDASENWGFFQMVNHGIPSNTLDEMINGVRRFHDQDPEVRKKFYAREESNKLVLTPILTCIKHQQLTGGTLFIILWLQILQLVLKICGYFFYFFYLFSFKSLNF